MTKRTDGDAAQQSPEPRHYTEGFLVSCLEKMLLIRLFEQRAEELIRTGAIPGSTHLSIGQEAVAVGVMMALSADDYAAGPHRGHHILLAKGLDEKRLMAELMGKSTGHCGGKGGHMHAADASRNMLGVNGIVGASIAIATGAAFTARYKERDQVAVAFFGDGAVNKGQFHENLNMASILNLPAIYVCENNRYAVETSVAYSTAGNNIAGRAASYDIPGVAVDGLDVLAVYEAAKEARSRAVGGKPTLIEALTYRYKGHHNGDVENYRTSEEVKEWMRKDPINRLRNGMVQEGRLDERKWQALERKCKERVEEAVRFGLESPDPLPESVMENVLAIGGEAHA